MAVKAVKLFRMLIKGMKLITHLLTQIEQVITLSQTLLQFIVNLRWRHPGIRL